MSGGNVSNTYRGSELERKFDLGQVIFRTEGEQNRKQPLALNGLDLDEEPVEV